MSVVNDKLGCRLSWIVFLFFAIRAAHTVASFTDVPPPPVRPERFHSREELRRYLQRVHEYYAIIGRPRFGRAAVRPIIDPADAHLFYTFDNNGDNSISSEEFDDLLDQ